MKKLIIEVGSTCTKVDIYDGEKIERLENITIQLKKHYEENKCLREEDVNLLVQSINKLKEVTEDIYVCGTSIFRTISEEEKEKFLKEFYTRTGYEFHIISQEEENFFTVYGVSRCINQKIGVMIGGGGSTEIAIVNDKILETVNSKIGVIDVMREFPDLASDIATTNIEVVKDFIRNKINLPKGKADILVLAGGGHERFARQSGITYKDNTLYKDIAASIMMDIETRKKDTKRFYEEISLNEIREVFGDKEWWYGTRAMCAFVLVVAEEMGAKYIVPTDITMTYGILNK